MASKTSSEPKFFWKPPVISEAGGGNTSQTAMFTHEGKNYKVTVSYNKQGLHTTYGIAEKEIDSRIKAIVSKISQEDLAELSGVVINASLTNLKESHINKKSESVSGTIENLEGEGKYFQLCATASKVISVFSQLSPKPKDEEEKVEKKQDGIGVGVEEVLEHPKPEKPEFTFEFEQVDETPKLPVMQKSSDEEGDNSETFQEQ